MLVLEYAVHGENIPTHNNGGQSLSPQPGPGLPYICTYTAQGVSSEKYQVYGWTVSSKVAEDEMVRILLGTIPLG